MTWKLFPTDGNLVVRPKKEEQTTKSGLFIPDNIVEKETHVCEIIETSDYSAFDLGQLVIIGKYNGRDVKITQSPGEPTLDFIIVKEADVLSLLVWEEPDES